MFIFNEVHLLFFMDCALGVLSKMSLPNAISSRFSPNFIVLHFLGGSMVRNSSANAEDAGDVGLIPGSGRFLEKEMATSFSVLAWKIPWTEEPGRLQSMGSQKSWT